jgi:hypothetical protein
MARKSRALRLSEAQALFAAYEAAGLEKDRSYTFLRDMVSRLQRKDISAGQKKYLDSLITQGVPQPKNPERCAEIQAAIETAGMEGMTQPLIDFKFKLSKGWNLSEKQEKFLQSLLTQATQLRETGMPTLSEEEKAMVEGLLRHAKTKGGYYWQHRYGTSQLMDRVKEFYATHSTVLERDLTRMRKAFKGVVRQLTEVRVPSGSLAYIRRDAVMVVSDPYINDHGQVVQEVLHNGEYKIVQEKQIGKRRSRG